MSAYTNIDQIYPGFINVTHLPDGQTRIVVRGDPHTTEKSSFICGFARDKDKPGHCTPGDAHCNNYCNMAPQKGPMQDSSAPCTQVHCGETVSLVIPTKAWNALQLEG